MANRPRFKKTALLGIGLMGGSLGLAMKERASAASVVGLARREETRREAMARGIVDSVTDQVKEAVTDADLVILGTPLLAYESLLEQARPFLSSECIVTDLGSTKAHVVAACERILEGSPARFVGGHPMTGSEESGPLAARADLYENSVWCLTPTERTDSQALKNVRELAELVGARILLLSPDEHDKAVAATSHVPHLLAAMLVQGVRQVSRNIPEALRLTAGGFRDTTRVASGSPEMWRDICLTNRDGIAAALSDFRRDLDALEKALADGNEEALLHYFKEAKEFREEVVKRGGNF
jgi:prephenate dehydrogenase